MMFDCWKNSCHGATVVPTIAMIRRTEVEFAPPWIPGTNRPWMIGLAFGWAMKNSGITNRLANTNTNIDRSQLRKLPVAVIAISANAAIGTAMYCETPK